ncbi:MAG: response regulator [Candidatus Auribacterota bacterium]|uniref:Response regulator n=1 Tax=Candidatus Auribacter fodinae TaxID=2093366 RepID=A0A3A4QV69_9BACT|nr:MAG: response regulator [Candidatus Auribacter fodinae]
MKVIVVDDSSTMRRIIKNTLSRLGMEDIVEAEHGLDALSKLDGIDLIFTDWNMPEMDGLTFVKSVRASQTYKHIPIIMVTTEAGKEDIVEAIKSGVNNYVVKPFTPEVLKSKIEAVIGK